MLKRLFFLPVLAAALLTSCSGNTDSKVARLPYIGERDVQPRADGGPADTVFASIPPFRLTDQARQVITNKTLAGHAYVASFFFATCPGICPKMHAELLKVYTAFTNEPRIAFISHTIDPAHDTIPVLLDYAHRMGVSDPNRWHFVTSGYRGEPAARDSVIALAHSYFTAAMPDQAAPGGIAHNGTLALVDDQGHIRGLYDSLNAKEVARLLAEVPLLLAEIDARQGKPAVAAK